MGAGKLKMWNADRGFGFIADDTDGMPIAPRTSVAPWPKCGDSGRENTEMPACRILLAPSFREKATGKVAF
jgi:hypothetical protein